MATERSSAWIRVTSLLVVVFLAGIAAAEGEAERKLEELTALVQGTNTPIGEDAARATAEQKLAWYGLMGTAWRIRDLEADAEKSLESGVREELSKALQALDAKAGSGSSMRAAGQLGGGTVNDELRGLSWYCAKVRQLQTALPARVQGLADNGAQHIAALRAIDAGKTDAAANIRALNERFLEGLKAWRSHPTTQQINADVDAVKTGLSSTVDAVADVTGAAGAARAAATKLRNEANHLASLADSLGERVDGYASRRDQVLRELESLDLEYRADLSRRQSLVQSLNGFHRPKTGSSQWRNILEEASRTRAKNADDADTKISSLASGVVSEAGGCKDQEAIITEFKALLATVETQTQSITQSVTAALVERTATINRMDAEATEIIATERSTAEKTAEWLKRAETRYDDANDTQFYRNPQLYEEIVKRRRVGADAAEAATSMELARQPLIEEAQEVNAQADRTPGALRGTVEFLYRW